MGMVQHTARRIDYLVGAAQVLARSEYVGSVSAERSQRGPRRDRNRRRLRDDQRTARIEDWRRWDIWHRRDLRGRNSDRQRNSCKRKTANACERHGVILTCTNIVRDRRFRYRGNRKRNSAAPNNQVSQKRESRSHAARRYERRYTGGRSVFVVESDGQGRPAPEYVASPVLSVTWAMPTLGYVFLRTGLAMEEL